MLIKRLSQGFFVLAFALNLTFLYFPPFGLPKSSIGTTSPLPPAHTLSVTSTLCPETGHQPSASAHVCDTSQLQVLGSTTGQTDTGRSWLASFAVLATRSSSWVSASCSRCMLDCEPAFALSSLCTKIVRKASAWCTSTSVRTMKNGLETRVLEITEAADTATPAAIAGGQAAGYAAADSVQALPLVSTFWGVLLFGEYRKSSKRTYILLAGALRTFAA